MSEDIQIQASLKIDSGDSKKRIDEINQSIAESKKALSQAVYGTKEYADAQKQLSTSSADLAKAHGALSTSAPISTFDTLKEKVQGLVPGLKSAESGVTSFGAQLKLLMANPIVLLISAIVAALGFLYEAFSTSIEGGKQLKQIFAAIEAAGTILKDAIFNLGRSFIDLSVAAYKFITLDISGAIESFKKAGDEASNSMKEFGKLTDGTLKKFAELEKAQQQNDLARKKSAVVNSETNKLLVQSREILTDETATINEKKKALAAVTDAETKSSVERVRIANEDLRIIKEKQAAFGIETENGKKLNGQIRELTIARNEAEQENAQTEVKLNKQRKQLDKQAKAEALEEDKKQKEALKAQREQYKEYESKLNALQNETYLAGKKEGYEKEKAIIDNAYKKENEALAQQLKEKKLTIEQFNILTQALDENNRQKVEALKEKDNKEKEAKEKDFQKALTDIRNKTLLDGMTDTRAKEKLQLKFEYEDKLMAAEKQYKDDTNKLAEFKAAIDAEQKAKQDALDEKNLKEDRKKKLDKDLKKEDGILGDPKAAIAAKRASLDLETSILKTALDQRVIDEDTYTNKIDELSKKRIEIDQLEAQQKIAQASEVGNTLGKLADLVGRQTAVGKGLAIAQSTINTWQGVTEALKQKSLLPSPFDVAAKVVNVGAVLASGFNAIKSIAAVNVPGGGGGGGGSTPSAPLSPQRASTSLDAASIQGVGNAASSGVGKSFVLATDIKDSQEREALLVRSARLG